MLALSCEVRPVGLVRRTGEFGEPMGRLRDRFARGSGTIGSPKLTPSRTLNLAEPICAVSDALTPE